MTVKQIEETLRKARSEQLKHGHDWDLADVLPVVVGLATQAWDDGFDHARFRHDSELIGERSDNPLRRDWP